MVYRHLALHSARRASLAVGAMLFGLLLAAPAVAQVQGEALVGSPFGVGRVTLRLGEGAIDASAMALDEARGRALYPAFAQGRVLRIIRSFLGGEGGDGTQLTVTFLFQGTEPLDLTLYTPTPHRVQLTPRNNPRQHNRLLNQWWRDYNAAVREQEKQGDYPPLVENYLTTMLGERLNLNPPLLTRLGESSPSAPRKSLDLLVSTEKLRLAELRQTLQGQQLSDVADRPVPEPIAWRQPPLPAPAAPATEVSIEEIARHVPEECFYVRFARYTNYEWLNFLLKDYAGDLSQMVTLRGHDMGLNKTVERQLALKPSGLPGQLVETVVGDVALIGRDTFTGEGAAIGMLFQAHNSLVLKNDFMNRRRLVAEDPANVGAKLETVQIAGREVSKLSTPDNSIRSFYAIDGQFHLVTTSRAMVERFFAVSNGEGSLGASAEFRHARALMPTSRDDTLFVYMSSAFFRGLLSPQYRIELQRRLQSVTDMELVQLARLTAKAEGRPSGTIEELVAAGFLPRGFGRRPDGSGPILETNRVIDSRRGARGTFTPVPDVELTAVTAREAAEFAEVAQFHSNSWNQMDPLMVGLRRYKLNDQGLERLVIDAHVTPFDAQKYGSFLSKIGPPTRDRLAPIEGDEIFVQAVLANLPGNAGALNHVFLGVQDAAPLLDLKSGGLLNTLRVVKSTPGYLGAWPKPGLLDMLPLGLAPQPDQFGYSQIPLLGLWRRELNGYSVLSFDRPTLDYVVPRLQFDEAAEPAQVRVHVADLSQSRLAATVNAFGFMRARQASYGNTRLLHALSQQLAVPREEALAVAEELLGVKFICTLGGAYRLREHPGGLKQWVSSAWGDELRHEQFQVPGDFTTPLLTWFRGVDADVRIEGEYLVSHAVLDMQRKEVEKKLELPVFNFNLFGGQKPDSGRPIDKPIPEAIPPGKPATGTAPGGAGEPSKPREF